MGDENTKNIRIAIPSMGKEGLDAMSSGHFGHCEAFTMVDISDNEIVNVQPLENPPHSQGGCMSVVGLLKENGIEGIIVGGIGMRPLMGFQQVGIDVYGGAGGTVASMVKAFLEGRLEKAGENVVCGHSRPGGCAGEH